MIINNEPPIYPIAKIKKQMRAEPKNKKAAPKDG